MVDSSVVEYVRDAAGRVGRLRSEKRTPDGLSNGLAGGDLIGSMVGGAAFVGFADCVGDGGV
jgi:hypothetical protein